MIKIELVYAHPEECVMESFEINASTTVKQWLEDFDILSKYGINLDKNKIGIFGQTISLERELKDGDRVEIYRPLINDPKEIRKMRAKSRS